MTGRIALEDEAARNRILTAHTETLFVEAGAGTGKTTALIARVVEMVAVGALTDIAQLAAITFTENAAAELRTRLRAALDEASRGSHRGRAYDDEQRARAAAALDRFDDAAVTTLHGFAARLLSEAPLEAGLPPGFLVHDPVSAKVERSATWRRFVDDLLDDPGVAAHLATGLALGLKVGDLQEVEDAFAASWDLLVARPLAPLPLPRPPAAAIAEHLRAALADAGSWPEDDKLTTHLRDVVAPVLATLEDIHDPDDLLAEMVERKLGCTVGRKESWRTAGLSKAEVVGHLAAAEGVRASFVADVAHAVTTTLATLVQDHVLAEADHRRDAGRLDFHDLLVRARDLLRDDEEARRLLRGRWRVILVDEFQDTDPLQVEIVEQLAAGRPVFYVGDPKQSIYRFRRADVELYAEVGSTHESGRVGLTVNFRSVPGIVAVVNRVFRALLRADGTAPHAELVGRREATVEGPAVTVLGGPGGNGDTADTLRQREAAHLADLLLRAHDGWWVESAGLGPRRPSYADMAILLPTRTSLPAIEGALQDRDIPYRVESRSLVWSTDAVRDLLTLLQAIDNPTDAVATVAALRHPGLACSDPDLAAWSASGGSWHAFAPTPSGCEGGPVDSGMATLRRYHDLRWWLPVHDLVTLVVRELRLVELTAELRRPRDHWRRLRFVVDQARAFADGGGSGLGAFVAWATGQEESEADLLETSVPEADDDAVRILTVHGAKGLEFPVTAVAGLGAGGGTPRVLWGAAGPQVRLRKERLETHGWEEAQTREKALTEAETRRLLYVAMTRARDHLVLGCYHKRPTGTSQSPAQRLMELLPEEPGLVTFEGSLPVSPPRPVVAPAVAPTVPAEPGARIEEEDARRAVLLAAAHARVATTPTSLVAEAAGGPGADAAGGPGEAPADAEGVETAADAEPDGSIGPGRWSPAERPAPRGRGAAIGTAVHRVLELVGPGDGPSEIRRLAGFACAESGITDLTDDVAGRVRTVLESPQVRGALAGGRAWREVFLVAPDPAASHGVGDPRMVEGYVDLLIETGGALAILDYKTDRAETPEERAAREAHYAPQLDAYRQMVERISGHPARTGVVFASPRPADPLRHQR